MYSPLGLHPQTPVNPKKFKLKGGKDPPTIFNFIGIECKCKKLHFVRVRRSRLTAAEPPAHAQNAHIM